MRRYIGELLRKCANLQRISRRSIASEALMTEEEEGDEVFATSVPRPSQQLMNASDGILQEKLKKTAMQIEWACHLTHRIPAKIRDEDWIQLTEMSNESELIKQLNFLCIVARQKLKRQRKKLERSDRLDPERKLENCLFNRTFLRRINDKTMKQYECGRQISMIKNRMTPTLIMDMAFMDRMTRFSRCRAGIQLSSVLSALSGHRLPWNTAFVNIDWNLPYMQSFFDKYLQAAREDLPFVTAISDRSYTELFDRDRIVYLSPDAKETLLHIEEDEFYVMSVYVDCGTKTPSKEMVSLASAKKHRVRKKRLPLDEFVKWETGHKMLPFNQVTAILQDSFANGGDWKTAIESNISVAKKLRKFNERSPLIRSAYMQYRETNRRVAHFIQTAYEMKQ